MRQGAISSLLSSNSPDFQCMGVGIVGALNIKETQ
jgi:hypothetical protein